MAERGFGGEFSRLVRNSALNACIPADFDQHPVDKASIMQIAEVSGRGKQYGGSCPVFGFNPYLISFRTSWTQKCQDIEDPKAIFVSGHRGP